MWSTLSGPEILSYFYSSLGNIRITSLQKILQWLYKSEEGGERKGNTKIRVFIIKDLSLLLSTLVESRFVQSDYLNLGATVASFHFKPFLT